MGLIEVPFRKQKKIIKKYNLSERDIDRIVEMAWEDRTSFDAIKVQIGVPEGDVIKIMRSEMKLSNWKNVARTRAKSSDQTSRENRQDFNKIQVLEAAKDF